MSYITAKDGTQIYYKDWSAILKIYPGLPHGMCATDKDLINANLLQFINAEKTQAAGGQA